MLRQRFSSILLVVWLVILFNIERYDLLGINLPSILYLISGAIVIAILLVPDFLLIRWYFVLVPVASIYAGYRVFTIENATSIPTWLYIGVEVIIIAITFLLGWFISRQVADIERTYDSLIMNSENSRTLDPIKGEDVFNSELFRARQYNRPMVMLVVKPPSLRDLSKIYKNHLSYQVSLQHRYLKSRVAQLSEALLYSTDPITTHGDNVVICLPETDTTTALALARRIAAVINASLGVDVEIGIVELSKEVSLYRDMLEEAEKNIYTFVNVESSDDDDDDQQPMNIFEDDDTIPIPIMEYEDVAASAKALAENMPIAQVRTNIDTAPRNKQIQEAKPSLYQRLIAPLFATQLFPLQYLRIKAEGVSKKYYNPDFWVNRLPYQSPSARAIYRYVKRILDVSLILLASPFILLVFGIVGTLIYIEDRGPIFYSQVRTGRGNRKFNMWKFRSMIVDANDEEKCRELGVFRNERGETVDADGNKLVNDPRITRIGRFIRKTSIDELPQLWNIFMGDMSLVGPRPTSFGVEMYEMSQTHRLSVKPGLTGLWQVYDRGDTDFDNRLIWDMRYIDKMCLWLDLQVLFLTFTQQILKRRGA